MAKALHQLAETEPAALPKIKLPVVLVVQGAKDAVRHALGEATEAYEVRYADTHEHHALMATLEVAAHRLEGIDLADNEQAFMSVNVGEETAHVTVKPIIVQLPQGFDSVDELEVFTQAQKHMSPEEADKERLRFKEWRKQQKDQL